MKKKSYLISLLFGLAGGLIAVSGYALFAGNDGKYSIVEKQDAALARYAKFSEDGAINFTTASMKATPAVVHIKSVSGGSIAGRQDDFFPFDFFGERFDYRSRPSVASGSGVIISKDGYIVTNNHVIEAASEVEVTLDDNRSYTASVVGTDPSTDLALVKIDENELPYLTFRDSDDLMVGEWVLAVGNPFNLTSTVTAGIVSAKARNINILNDRFKIESFIQTDAAVNPGNSGGALITITGELVGINTAIASKTGSYSGYSFAVPSNIVEKVVQDLIEYGAVQRGFLGVMIRDVDSDLMEKENLSATKGVFISEVNESSAAEDAGLKSGDVIVEVDGVKVENSAELQEQIGRRRPGDNVKVKVLRGSNLLTKNVVLKNQSGNTKIVEREKSASIRELGAEFSPLSEANAGDYEAKTGLKVERLYAGKLRAAGVREGFLITRVDKKKILSQSDLEAAIENAQGAVLVEGEYPNGRRAAYAVMF